MFQEGLTYQKTISMVTVQCCNCGVVFGIPSDLNDRFRDDPDKYFYCPSGHRQHYSESREVKLRKEAEAKLLRTQNELSQTVTAKIQLESELNKTQRKLKRVHNGTCPCCKRSFKDLAAHMLNKHPEVVKASKQN